MLEIWGMEKYKHELDCGQFITHPLILAILMKELLWKPHNFKNLFYFKVREP